MNDPQTCTKKQKCYPIYTAVLTSGRIFTIDVL